jgi:predicted CoA-binding protein
MIDKARELLGANRIALVGISRDAKSFSRYLLRELVRGGYDVVPVSPLVGEVEGLPCCARLQDVRPPVAGALILTPASSTEAVVRDCIEAGVRVVWMHRGQGAGAASRAAIDLCRTHGIHVVRDLCPFMVLPGAAWPHRLHGYLRRLAL